jgi:sulfide:quinone oxidoreductase
MEVQHPVLRVLAGYAEVDADNYSIARVVAAVTRCTCRAYAEDVPKLHAVHHRAKILVAGGGVAGLEAMLALRSLLGATVEIELLSPDPEFHYRPIAVAEPFGLGEVRRLELAKIAADNHAHLRLGALGSVDAAAGTISTGAGEVLEYDHLVVAVGAKQTPAIEGALTFGGSADRQALEDVIARAKRGELRRIVFAAPSAVAWLLPLYELALFTAAWAREQGIPDLELTLVTHESRPLEAFGPAAGDTLAGLLASAGVRLLPARRAQRFDGERVLIEAARTVPADAVIALPVLVGPAIVGLPHDEQGFIPIDRHCAVRGVRCVYAAGDGVAFPIKQGGLASQQADAAASAIAAEIGVLERPEPFHPVLRGLLLTGSEPRYLRVAPNGSVVQSEVSFQPLWWPPGKIAGRYLAPYLATPHDPSLVRAPLEDRPTPDEPELAERAGAEGREAVELLLELADANARCGSFDFALKCLEAAEDVGGPLPARRQADRREWDRERLRSAQPSQP